MGSFSSHYCPRCIATVAEEAASCPECQSGPGPGWPLISESSYPWLGHVLEERYQLNKFLGSGATGVVYRAQALKIRRQFAVKIVDISRYGRQDFADELLSRFRSEVQAMSRIRNPHVIGVYEVIQLSETIFVLVMEYVNGRTLEQVLEQVGRVKPERALDIIRQVANGLYEAHTLGFIHRDLKPENIMLEKLPASGFFAKILDFGIVHEIDGAGQTQGFRGTPLYASPEQCLGDPVDHRSDIYSLGCVFFHLLTGRPPFVAKNSMKAMQAHVCEQPPKIREIAPNTRIGPGIEDLVGRMLAKEPERRPLNMSEVIREVDKLIFQPSLEEETDLRSPSEVLVPNTESLAEATLNFPDRVTSSSLDRCGSYGAVATSANEVHVWNTEMGTSEVFRGSSFPGNALHLDMDTGQLFAGDTKGSVLAWEILQPEKGHAPTTIITLTDGISALAKLRHQEQLLIGTESGCLVVASLKQKHQVELLKGREGISALGVSPRENKVLVGYTNGQMALVDWVTKITRPIDRMASKPVSIVCSEDGYVAAVLDQSQNLRVLSLVDGATFFEVRQSVALSALAFDANSQLMGMRVTEGQGIELVQALSKSKVGPKVAS